MVGRPIHSGTLSAARNDVDTTTYSDRHATLCAALRRATRRRSLALFRYTNTRCHVCIVPLQCTWADRQTRQDKTSLMSVTTRLLTAARRRHHISPLLKPLHSLRNNRRDRARLIIPTFRWRTNNVLVPQLLGRSFQKARNFTASSHHNAGFSI